MTTKPSGPVQPSGSKQTSTQGAWGGGNSYTQMPKTDNDFKPVSPFSGHSQKGNMTPVIKVPYSK